MAAPKESSLFPPNPYHIPGYEGFIPQYNYQCGETFGKTTYRLLTDPTVVKSPHPLLAPLHKENFVEDLRGTQHSVQGYHSGLPDEAFAGRQSLIRRELRRDTDTPETPRAGGYFYSDKAEAATSSHDPTLGPNPLLLRPAEEKLMMMHMAPLPQHYPSQYIPRTRLPWDYLGWISSHPASEEPEMRFPELSPARGQGKGRGSSQLGHALAGGKPPLKTEDGTLPGVAEITDVEQEHWFPKLNVANVIQQKVIPGYAGFIPRLTWINGVNYTQGVKEAMAEFARYQFLQRNPACSFGKRFPRTYWPENRIYTSAGLIPFYAGFVPDLRHTYALTFGNGTRKAYEKEQRRRAGAL